MNLLKNENNVLDTFKKNFKYLILAVLVYFPIFEHLGFLPIRIWDEARLSINAYEMYKNGNYIVTHFEGLPDMWNTKPPFLIWCQVFFMKIIGVNELAVRLPSAIAALGTCVLLLLLSNKYLKNIWFGFIAVLVLITSSGYIEVHAARTGDYDALLAFFTTLGGLSYFAFIETKKNKYLYGFFFAMTFAVLTKSITGLLFLPALFAYTLWQKKLVEIIKNKHVYIGIFIFVGIVLAYYFLREHYNPGYLKAVWENDLWGRFNTSLDNHVGPFLFYHKNFINFQYTAWYFLVPCGFLLGIFDKDVRVRKVVSFSALMAVSFFLAISKAKTKIEWYDVPLYPFLAIMVSVFIYRVFDFAKNNETVNSYLSYNISPFIVLFLFFVSPYQKIYDKFATYTEPPYYYNYNLSHLLKKAVAGKEDCNNFYLLHEGYYAQNLFYLNILKDKGVNISTKDWTKLEAGDLVIVHQQNIQDYVNNTYHGEWLWQENNVVKYKITGRK